MNLYRAAILIIAFMIAGKINAQGNYLETIKVTDNIYVFKPKIDWSHSNGIAIIGNDGVFFIDTYIESTYAHEAIKRLRSITKLPVKYVLNTHWHYDHVMGNYEFKKAFPDCKFVMHDSTYAGMIKYVKTYTDSDLVTTKQSIEILEKERKDLKRSNGQEIIGSMVPFWDLQIKETKEYLRDYRPLQMVNGDITFNDSLTFHWGSQTIKLIYIRGGGHSKGDVVAWIPEIKLVCAGDIVVGPTPYSTAGNAPGMVVQIQRIIDMDPSIIIPGHGVVEYDLSYVNLLKKAFTAYIDATEDAIKNNIPLKDVVKSIHLDEIDNAFTGDDETKKWAYRSFFENQVIVSIYKKHGLYPAK